jgi:hypothetical protein
MSHEKSRPGGCVNFNAYYGDVEFEVAAWFTGCVDFNNRTATRTHEARIAAWLTDCVNFNHLSTG